MTPAERAAVERDEWKARELAKAPALTQAQQRELRRVLLPALVASSERRAG